MLVPMDVLLQNCSGYAILSGHTLVRELFTSMHLLILLIHCELHVLPKSSTSACAEEILIGLAYDWKDGLVSLDGSQQSEIFDFGSFAYFDEVLEPFSLNQIPSQIACSAHRRPGLSTFFFLASLLSALSVDTFPSSKVHSSVSV